MRTIVLRCDGGTNLGMGHVMRSLALAAELRDAHGCAVTFAMRDPGSAGAAAVHADGFDIDAVPDAPDAGLARLLSSRRASVVVIDVRDELSRASLDTIRRTGVKVVTIDDASERRLASDLACFPPVPQVQELDWAGFTGTRYAGWEWVILRREFESGRSGGSGGRDGEGESGGRDGEGGSRGVSPGIDVLVTMGGGDSAGMTEFAIRALALLPMPLAVQVVVGPAFPRTVELIDAVARSKHHIQIAVAPASMAALMRTSRIAVASFGMSAYELAACGVPAVHLCLTEDHARSSSAFEAEGIALTAGVFGRVLPAQVADAVAHLMGNAGRRGEMGARARRLVDGRGARRVAGEIVRLLP